MPFASDRTIYPALYSRLITNPINARALSRNYYQKLSEMFLTKPKLPIFNEYAVLFRPCSQCYKFRECDAFFENSFSQQGRRNWIKETVINTAPTRGETHMRTSTRKQPVLRVHTYTGVRRHTKVNSHTWMHASQTKIVSNNDLGPPKERKEGV